MTEKEFREKERRAAMKRSAAKAKARRKKRAVTVITITLSVMLVFIVALIVALFFRVNTVVVNDNTIYTAEQIIKAAGIEAGDNMVFLNTKVISQKIQKELPFIESVTIKRELPSTLKITVTETKENICFFDSGVYYTASSNFKILNEYSSRPEKLMVVITGGDCTLKKGESFVCGDKIKDELIDKLIGYANGSKSVESIINVSDTYDCFIVFDNSRVARLGSSTYIDGKLKFLTKMIESTTNDEHNYFDLSDWTPDNDEAYLRKLDDISRYLEIK